MNNTPRPTGAEGWQNVANGAARSYLARTPYYHYNHATHAGCTEVIVNEGSVRMTYNGELWVHTTFDTGKTRIWVPHQHFRSWTHRMKALGYDVEVEFIGGRRKKITVNGIEVQPGTCYYFHNAQPREEWRVEYINQRI